MLRKTTHKNARKNPVSVVVDIISKRIIQTIKKSPFHQYELPEKFPDLVAKAIVLLTPILVGLTAKGLLAGLMSIGGILDPGGIVSSLLSFGIGGAWYLICERGYQKFRRSKTNFSYASFATSVAIGSLWVIGSGCAGLVVALFVPGMTQLTAFSVGIFASLLSVNLVVDYFTPQPVGPAAPPPKEVRGMGVRDGVPENRKWIGRLHKRVLRWGDSFIRDGYEFYHGFVVSATGGGKTTFFLHAILNRIVPLSETEEHHCGIVNDPKCNMRSLLSKLLPEYKYYVMDLTALDDPRYAGFQLFLDMQSPQLIAEFCDYLIPTRKNDSSSGTYFEGNARRLLEAVMYCLWLLLGEKAEFRDVILACREKAAIIGLLSQKPDLFAGELEMLQGHTADDIVSTLRNLMVPYSVVAAAWHQAPHKISATTLLEEGAWAILGADPSFPKASHLASSLFIEFVLRYNLSLPDVDLDLKYPRRKTTIVLDELQSSRPIESLGRATEMGRSKGISLWLSFLNVPGFQEVYGEKVMQSIIANCSHQAFLGLDGASAQYFSKEIGENSQIVESFTSGGSTSSGHSTQSSHWSTSSSHSKQAKIENVKAVLAQELLRSNPAYNKENGLFGYYVLPEEGIHKTRIPWSEIDDWTVYPSPDSSDEGRIDPNDPRLTLQPWSDAERQRLGLPTTQELAAERERREQQRQATAKSKQRQKRRKFDRKSE